jgi:hypothetical protein
LKWHTVLKWQSEEGGDIQNYIHSVTIWVSFFPCYIFWHSPLHANKKSFWKARRCSFVLMFNVYILVYDVKIRLFMQLRSFSCIMQNTNSKRSICACCIVSLWNNTILLLLQTKINLFYFSVKPPFAFIHENLEMKIFRQLSREKLK